MTATATAWKTHHCRWLIRRDIPQTVAIEQATAPHRKVKPWTECDFDKALRNRFTIGMVTEREEQITGFMVYRLRDAHSIELLRFVAAYGTDAGAVLWAKMLYKLGSHRRKILVVAVRPEWKTPDVQVLAKLAYPPLPILADALQEAGCEEWITEALRDDSEDDTAHGMYRALRAGGLLSE